MKDESSLKHAFKVEWAIWQALAEGKQSILFNPVSCSRNAEKFRVKYTRFWLIPAGNRQQTAGSRQSYFTRYFAEVTGVYHVHDRLLAHMLAHLHLWNDAEVEKRFACPPPGLLVLVVRVFRVPPSETVDDVILASQDQSWIELETSFSIKDASQVMSEQVFADLNLNLSMLLNPTAYA